MASKRTFTFTETSKIVNICIVNYCIIGPLRIHRLVQTFFILKLATAFGFQQSVDQNPVLNCSQTKKSLCTK